MSGFIPYTGTAIAMGKVYAAFAGGPYPPSAPNISLSSVLGPFASVSTGTQISLSDTFGAKPTPYPYP